MMISCIQRFEEKRKTNLQAFSPKGEKTGDQWWNIFYGVIINIDELARARRELEEFFLLYEKAMAVVRKNWRQWRVWINIHFYKYFKILPRCNEKLVAYMLLYARIFIHIVIKK